MVAQAKITEQRARREFDRAQQLKEPGLITQQNLTKRNRGGRGRSRRQFRECRSRPPRVLAKNPRFILADGWSSSALAA
jgi:hypothetical protein